MKNPSFDTYSKYFNKPRYGGYVPTGIGFSHGGYHLGLVRFGNDIATNDTHTTRADDDTSGGLISPPYHDSVVHYYVNGTQVNDSVYVRCYNDSQ